MLEADIQTETGTPFPQWLVRQDDYGHWYVKMEGAQNWGGPYIEPSHAVAVVAEHFNEVLRPG